MKKVQVELETYSPKKKEPTFKQFQFKCGKIEMLYLIATNFKINSFVTKSCHA